MQRTQKNVRWKLWTKPDNIKNPVVETGKEVATEVQRAKYKVKFAERMIHKQLNRAKLA